MRLDVLAHGRPVDALARMVARDEAATLGRALLGKMKDLLDRQQFEVVLQVWRGVNGGDGKGNRQGERGRPMRG